MERNKDIAETNTILRGEVGSTVLGISIKDQDDLDEMGVCVEPPTCMLGLQTFDHYTFRTQPEGMRSGPGDNDLVIYGLRKYCRLAVQGNPSILLLLWLPEAAYRVVTPIGRGLVNLRDAFVSRESGKRFLGYMRGQKARLNGERSPCVSRPELVERYGYDTKFAGHAVRLGLMGVEYMSERRVTVPIPHAELIRDIRTGRYTKPQVLGMIEEIDAELSGLVDRCDLVADTTAVERYMLAAYNAHWNGGGAP